MIKAAILLTILLTITNGSDFSGSTFLDYVRFVSSESHKNIVFDEKLDTKFNLVLPADYKASDNFETFKKILYKHDMYIEKVGSIYYIKKYSDSVKFRSIEFTFAFPKNYLQVFKKYYPKLDFIVSKRKLIFKSDYKDYKDILSLVKSIDSPLKSKKIKIVLISYNKNNLREVGLNFDAKITKSSYQLGYKTLVDSLITTSSFSMVLPTSSLSMYIADLSTKNLVDLKFAPIVSLFNDKPASISLVQNIPFLSSQKSVNGSNDISNNAYIYKDIGSTINIDKVSITDKSVYFHIRLVYGTIIDKTATPTTAKKSVDNYLSLKDGETLLIAGLNTSELRHLHREIPILSSIPLLGNAFKWDSNINVKTQFAVLISNIDSKIKLALSAVEKEAPRSGEKGAAAGGALVNLTKVDGQKEKK